MDEDWIAYRGKKFIKENKSKLIAAAVGVTAIGVAYYYGKSKGELTFEFNFVPKSGAAENPIMTYRP